MDKQVCMILAMDTKNGIGKGGQLPWHIKEDMSYFKEVSSTTLSSHKKNAVIMGRKTWESIPEKFRPLPNRVNIILSRSEELSISEKHFSSLENALSYLNSSEEVESIFIIGGAQIYNEAIKKDIVDIIYLTRVFGEFDCDTSFIGFGANFALESISERKKENEISFQFEVYQKTRSVKIVTQSSNL